MKNGGKQNKAMKKGMKAVGGKKTPKRNGSGVPRSASFNY